MNETTNLESVGISVDSLDNSCFEQKCAEVVNRCKKQDKSKYTIVFEPMEESTNESLLNYERYLAGIKRNEIYLNKLFNDLNRRLHNDKLADKLSRSEYSTTNALADEQSNQQHNQSSQHDLNNVSKLTKSLQNDLISSLRQQLDPNDYVPLFNLTSSLNSDSSSISAPKSLMKVFIQNQNSPNSSSGGPLNVSLESNQSPNQHCNNEHEDKKQTRNTTNSRSSSTKTTEVQTSESMNQNAEERGTNSVENPYSIGNLYTPFRSAPDNLLVTAGSTASNLKMYHNRKTSPIREEDEQEASTIKEVKKYTSFQQTTAMCRNQNQIETSLQANDNERTQANCPRSVSMNDFSSGSKRPNLIKQYSLKNSSTGHQAVHRSNAEYQPQQYSTRPTMSRTNRNSKECSISSGYLSSGGSNNMFVENNRKHIQQQQQKLFQQQPQQSTSYEDKQVQTSIYSSVQPTPILINELPNSNCCTSSNAPIYVYYPNYSLPDLHFVHNGSFQNVHLSPTKFQPASFDFNSSCCSKVKRRVSTAVNNRSNARTGAASKTRPKSTGDFEKLTKESLNHIQDWESLKTLLPDDIKELIRTLNLRSDDEDGESKMKSKTTSNTPTSNRTFQMAIQNSQQIKLRPKVLSRGSSIDKNRPQPDQYNCASTSQNNKRFSLQEPIRSGDCMLNCSSTNTHSDASCCSNHQTRRGMIKSATMNMPIVFQQQQQQRQQMHSRMLYQTPCHSCCSINQLPMCYHQPQMMNMGSCCQCSGASHHCLNHLNNNQCTGINYSMMNNYCAVPTVDQQYYHYQQQFKTSPMKPCNPITEQNEENDFESLNCLMQNENENGELDFDRLLDCKVNQTDIVRKRKTTTVAFKNKLSDCPKEFRNSKENFNDLKNHWEKVANSTSFKQATATTANSKKSMIVNHQQPAKSSEQPNKSRPTTSRYARGQVKSKVNSRRSRSKSPEKSNKEVIILTTKKSKTTSKPQAVALKPGSSNTVTKASTTTRQTKTPVANQQPVSTASKKPVRPSSFSTQFKQPFKSMIPVAKNSNRSPPTK